MSLPATARAIGDDLRGATPWRRERWKAVIKAVIRVGVIAYRELPQSLMFNLGGGLMELVIKAKAGFNLDKMLAKARSADADVDQLVTEIQQEIEDELRADAERQQGSSRLELGSGGQAITDPGRSIGPGDAPAAAETKALAPGIPRRR